MRLNYKGILPFFLYWSFYVYKSACALRHRAYHATFWTYIEHCTFVHIHSELRKKPHVSFVYFCLWLDSWNWEENLLNILRAKRLVQTRWGQLSIETNVTSILCTSIEYSLRRLVNIINLWKELNSVRHINFSISTILIKKYCDFSDK